LGRLLTPVQKSKGHSPLFFRLAFAIFCVQALFFLAAFCDLVRSILLRSLALALRFQVLAPEPGTRPGVEFKKGLDKKKGEQLLP